MGASVGVSVGCVLVRICASVGFTPFVPTHPRDEGMVKETWGFVGERDLLRESIRRERFCLGNCGRWSKGRKRRWNERRFFAIINWTIYEESA